MLCTPFSQLNRPLSAAELTGETARSYALVNDRLRQRPIQPLPRWHVAFAHPPISSPRPAPPLHHPLPVRRPPLTAA